MIEFNEPVEWYYYSKLHPPRDGYYLCARNNWNRVGGDGKRVHSYDVSVYYWGSYSVECDGEMKWHDGDHEVYDPDQWAYVPYPEKAREPKYDPSILKARLDKGESPEMDAFEHKFDAYLPPLFEAPKRKNPILFRRFD